MQIGDKVVWTVGKVESKGVFLESYEDGYSLVITHFVGGQIGNREVRVMTALLKCKQW